MGGHDALEDPKSEPSDPIARTRAILTSVLNPSAGKLDALRRPVAYDDANVRPAPPWIVRLTTRVLPGHSLVEAEALLPDVATGLRAAVATVLPLSLAVASARPEWTWMALGGWLGTLVDPGGARRDRAILLGAFATLGALTVALCERAASATNVAPWVLAGVAFLTALVRAFGTAAATLSTMLLVVAALAITRPSTDAWREALAFALGGGLAALLSSILWPIWTHLPVRRSLATVFLALEAYALAVAHCIEGRAPEAEASPGATSRPRDDVARWTAVAREQPGRVRESLEAARAMSLAIHAQHAGETATGSNLRVLLALADSQFLVLVSLASELEVAASPETQASFVPRLEGWAARAHGVRDALVAHDWAVRPTNEGFPVSHGPAHLDALMNELLQQAATSLSLAGTLGIASASGSARPSPDRSGLARPAFDDAFSLLREALSRRSPVLRQALRVTLAALVASAVGAWISPQQAAWVTLTAFIVLQPHLGATFERAVERAVGTILGGLLAVMLALAHPGPLTLAALMFPLSVAAVTTRPRSYRLFTFFLTPVFVLVAMQSSGSLWVAGVRAIDTVVGGAIAFAVSLLVFPRWEERIGLPEAMAAMKEATFAYVKAVEHRGEVGAGEVAAARKEAALAVRQAEESLDRIFADPVRRGPVAPASVDLVTFARKLVLAATTLDVLSSRANAGELEAVRERVKRFAGLLASSSP